MGKAGMGQARIGEALAPSAVTSLHALGVCEHFYGQGHLESPGRVCVWGSEQPYEHEFVWNPLGNGWQIDRARFDAMLTLAAEDAGAHIYRGARLQQCCADATGGWRIEAHVDDLGTNRTGASDRGASDRGVSPGDANQVDRDDAGGTEGSGTRAGSLFIQADYVVDASGRGRCPFVSWPEDRRNYDRLIGLVANFRLPQHLLCAAHHSSVAGPESDCRMLIEAVEEGWWYSAPLPSYPEPLGPEIPQPTGPAERTSCAQSGVPTTELAVALMTDFDLLGGGGQGQSRWWRQLRAARHTWERVQGGSMIAPPRIVAANTYRRAAVAGEKKYLRVGDAAAAYDPLSGHGLTKALESGLSAARAISEHLDGCHNAIQEYEEAIEGAFEDYLTFRMNYYQSEQRWPQSQFWQRRH
jgi:hypothetical protein